VGVSAENPTEAKEKAKDIILNNQDKSKFQHFYETTLPIKDWRVILKDDLIKMENAVFKDLEVEDDENDA
jgi:hypothetical protein